MTDALIGSSGFVGGAIQRHRGFDALYRSTNIGEIGGREFDTIVCCGAPAEKWRANKEPEQDRERLATLTAALARASARRFILVSTVDVYPVPVNVDERTPIDPSSGSAYGRHRHALEVFCADQFDCTIVRLPALFGHGLKKNAVFDLLNERPMDAMPGNARFQFYDVERTWADIERVIAAHVRVANITCEPLAMNNIARHAFGRVLPTPVGENAPSYDVRSIHAGLAGGANGYWYDGETVLAELTRFVERERATRA